MQIMLRFFNVERGTVSIDGVDIALADPQEVRKRMALVPQDPVIFSANAWENIRYGRPDATNEEVRKAADAAQATEFLERMPDGFNSFLGEKGMRLSGGQRQRLSIARALLRDPGILLLDEATSALDAENERIVQAALERLMTGRTTLIIAHRLATVVNADRICVIDQGRIQAIGTHQQLMETSKLYNHLAKLQFSADVTQ
jgi:ATP-binding cassette subfamily B protein